MSLGKVINMKDNGNAKLGTYYLPISFPLFLKEEKRNTKEQIKKAQKEKTLVPAGLTALIQSLVYLTPLKWKTQHLLLSMT